MNKFLQNFSQFLQNTNFIFFFSFFGKAIPLLRGKKTAPRATRHDTQQLSLPAGVDRRIKLYIDIFYVNGNTFFHAKAKPVDFITIQKLNDRRRNTIKKTIERIKIIYSSRGFLITDVFANNEFDNQEYEQIFLPARLHICAKREHVPIIERSIRTIKERTRSICQDVP